MTVTVPWGTLRGRDALDNHAAEVPLHAWDLTVSIGVEPNSPEPDTSGHYEMAQAVFPAAHRGVDVPFGQVTEPAKEAPVMDRQDAWMGRDTARWS